MARSRHGQRKGGSLRRQVAVRIPKRTFLVFCEGEKTEPAYSWTRSKVARRVDDAPIGA
jgi:hypothetical protein